MLLEGDDIEFQELPPEWMKAFEDREPKFRVTCHGCGFTSEARANSSARKSAARSASRISWRSGGRWRD